ncbi:MULTISPECIES: MFS transporter [unclassified Enterococcus]|uniref:MFS transporter n=1 Tax=unclassified Enterococcus TaxID=2608891 RepID=UPI0013EBF5B9|nr:MULTISPECIES: MFS transporter [unclassified Enterococcus]
MSKRNLIVATIALLLANFMGGLDATIVNTALPEIVSDLQGIRYVGWISSLFLLGTAVSTVLWGRIADIFENKQIFQVATVIFILSSLVGGLATNMLTLIIARGFMGIGAGGMVSIPFIIYAKLYPDMAGRARALARVTAAYTLSTVIGPIIGGFIVDYSSWHWVFLINLPIGILAVIMLQFSYHEDNQEQVAAKFDYLGAGILSIALIFLLFAGDALAVSHLRAITLLIFGLVSLGVFVVVESRMEDALIPIKLLSDWKIQSQNVIMFLMNGFFIGYSIYSPMWAQGVLGTNATRAGMTQIASSILLLLGTRLTANLMRNIPAKKIVILGLISVFLSAVSLVMATQDSPYWWLMMSGAFEGFGVGLAFTPMQVSIQDGVKAELVNVSTTFGLLSRTLGQTFMASIYGGVLSLRIANLVGQTNGQITVSQMNQLTDHETASHLPQNLIPEMQRILFESLHSIMLIGFFLIVAAIIINVIRKEPLKQFR